MRKYLDGYVPQPPVIKWLNPREEANAEISIHRTMIHDDPEQAAHNRWMRSVLDKLAKELARKRMPIEALALSFLNRADEDWTYVDPEDVKRLARAVLDK